MSENQNNVPAAPSLRLNWGEPLEAAEASSADDTPALPWLHQRGGLSDTAVPDSPEGLESAPSSRRSERLPSSGPDRGFGRVSGGRSGGQMPGSLPPPSRPDATPPASGMSPEAQEGIGQEEADSDELIATPFNRYVRQRSAVPSSGWRRVLYSATGYNPGLSKAEESRRALARRARARVSGCRKVTVISSKGGVGKTTITILVGSTLAEQRGDRVGALDANPDSGTLGDRGLGEDLDRDITVRGLVEHADSIDSLTDLSRHTQIKGRLQIVASDQDPAMSEAFSRDEYDRVMAQMHRFFNVCITDCGTGLMHDTVEGALSHTDTLVVVTSPTIDAADRAKNTLDWLVEHNHGHLVKDAVIAVSCDRSSKEVDSQQILEYFQLRCRAVVQVPYDPHLATGGQIDMDQLSQRTRDAALELAAAVADGFQPTRRSGSGRSS